ncbi:MAG TPA: polysaccharide biosynthesis/export family protein [Pyrinomonadaceae bacterium]|jgi:protein involved in polysaccharide export with SLBB domain
MKNTLLGKFSIAAFLFCCASSMFVYGQKAGEKNEKVNFRYSQNPKIKTKTPQQAKNEQNKTANPAEGFIASTSGNENSSIARKTLEIAKHASIAALSPTEVYKVGIGDILFINLQNSPKDSTYYTILNDGTIDYPLAGEMISVAGLTTEEIEEVLRRKIKLYENPEISVTIREFASHIITVLGLVEKAGEKKLQREAVPLYVVRAEAIVQSKATQAVIRRKNADAEILNLKDAKSDEVLVFPGDIIEFNSGNNGAAMHSNFYYIGGGILSGGQKEFYQGLTLTQAILAAGGLKKSNVKKVVIRRKNSQGMLISWLYDLKAIKDGKAPDPTLELGDTIEIGD